MRFLLLALGGLLPAVALAEPVDFAIPAETADRALLVFSKQAGIEVFFPFDALSQAHTPAVVGRYERDQALGLLLTGTGFVARQNGRGTFVITAAPLVAPAAGLPAAHSENKVSAPEGTTHLEPYLVKGRSTAGTGFTQVGQTSTGDVDLLRTENDALPFEVYSRARIASSGAVNLEDFLRQEVLESDAASPPLDELGGPNGFFDGSTNLNLRGFGSDETVVLLNGLPMPRMLSGYNSGSTTREADVNLVPINLVERIEILPVSASALYSGNPVGGVINIVLRPIENLDQITLTYSNGTRIDAPQSSYSFVHGQTLLGGKLTFRLDANYTRTTPPTEGELGFIKANLAAHPDLNLPLSYPASSLDRATPNIVSDNSLPLFGPGSAIFTSVAPGADGTGGVGAYTGRAGVPSTALFQAPGGNSTSPNSLNYAYGRKQETTTYFGSVSYDLSAHLQLGWNGLYSHTVTNPGYDVFQSPKLLVAADSPMNPFGQAVDVYLNETAPALGQGYDEAHIDLYSLVFGGLLKLPHDWRLTADAQYSRALTRYRGLAGVDADSWQALVDSGQYNPFRDTQVYAPPPAFYQHALIYYGSPGQFITLDNDQTIDTAARATNAALELPTGTGAVNVGTDYSVDHSANFNDDQRLGDGTVANTSGEWVGRTLQSFSAFGELQFPLVPSRWLPGWLHQVGADVAARYNASNVPFGTNVSPTFGLKATLAGGFSLRASISHTNRFPTSSLNHFDPVPGGIGAGGGPITSNDIVDPLRGDEKYTVPSSDLPVVNLRPEADITQSVGAVFLRGNVHRFRAAVDFFDTYKSGEEDDFGAQDIINVESLLPGRVIRAAPAPGDPFAAGPITSVLTGAIPVAWRHSQNWNTTVDYAWTECHGGALQVYARWAYFEKYARAVLADSVPVDELNNPDTSSLDLLRNRINFGAGWSNRRFGFGLDGQYFSDRVVPTNLQSDQGGRHIDSFFPFAAYAKGDLAPWLPWSTARFGLTAQLRVNNIFSAALPAFPNNPSGTGVEPYGDWRGQVYSLSVTASY